MGQGFGELTKIIAANEAARQSSFGPDYLRFTPSPGKTEIIRPLEQGDDVVFAYCYKQERHSRNGKIYNRFIVTRDQAGDGSVPCPIRERDLKVGLRVWLNVLWRNAPVYGKNEKGWDDRTKIIDQRDQVAVWTFGPVVATSLAAIDQTYKGLMSRDFSITAHGTGFDRRYDIFPADPDGGAQKMSDADRALAAEKYDLRQLFTTAKSYEEIKEMLDDAGGAPGTSGADPSASDFNPFANKR